MQDAVELGRSPAGAGLRSLISFIWKTQLLLYVLPNPLCEFCRQPAQDRVGCPPQALVLTEWIDLVHRGVTMASTKSCRVSALGYTKLVLVYSVHHILVYTSIYSDIQI